MSENFNNEDYPYLDIRGYNTENGKRSYSVYKENSVAGWIPEGGNVRYQYENNTKDIYKLGSYDENTDSVNVTHIASGLNFKVPMRKAVITNNNYNPNWQNSSYLLDPTAMIDYKDIQRLNQFKQDKEQYMNALSFASGVDSLNLNKLNQFGSGVSSAQEQEMTNELSNSAFNKYGINENAIQHIANNYASGHPEESNIHFMSDATYRQMEKYNLLPSHSILIPYQDENGNINVERRYGKKESN